jgi:gas vesicle protein
VFLILVEGIANSVLFAQGTDHGYIGGFMLAALFSCLNVITAYLLGKVPIRYIFHSNLIYKLLGFAIVLLTIAWLCLVALSIGHIRDALQVVGSENAPEVALQTMLLSPTELKDIYSWLLFSISITFGIVAVFDGVKSSDLYPGYERIAKKTAQSIQDYDEEVGDLRQELEDLKEEYLKNLDAVSNKVQVSVKTIQTRIDDKRSTNILLENKLKDAKQAMAALLQRYRTENKLARTDQAFPDYFNVLPELQPLSVPNFELNDNARYLAEQQNFVNDFLSKLQTSRARIQSSHTQKFDGLQPIQNQF